MGITRLDRRDNKRLRKRKIATGAWKTGATLVDRLLRKELGERRELPLFGLEP